MWQENRGVRERPWLSRAKRYGWLWAVLPAVGFLLLFFLGGFAYSVWFSFTEGAEENGGRGWAYRELAAASFLCSLAVTTGTAGAAAFLAGLAGLAIVLVLVRYASSARWLQILLQIPMGIPHLLAAYLLAQVLWQSGWFSRLAYRLGWIREMGRFPVLVQDPWGIGVLLAYLWKEIPFIVLLLFPFAMNIMREWGETAGALGASFFQTVRWVLLPLLLPLWVGGMWVVFAFVLAAYEIPALLASTSPGWVPVLAWQEYALFGLERRPVAMAMNLVLTAVALFVGIGLFALERRWYRRGRRFC
ncbi:hypothetical protein BSNK01_16720 [Bacillaceae bacterium]